MTKVEKIKSDSNYLRGTLKESIKSGITGAIADDDQIILKFHGSYQQDDRDARDRRAEKKLEKLFSFMIRLRIAGGKISAKEWIGINKVAQQNANPTIKITTRQTIQLHGVIKSKLKPTIASFYEYGLDSIAACGDVNRNVMTSVAIAQNKGYDEVYEYGKKISDYLLPHTKAYHEIWLDEEQISGEPSPYLGGGSAFATKSQVAERGGANIEPLYGKTYLPRKFKIVIAIPPENDVDLYAHDIGLIAIIENDELLGFNVTVGGGMGATHGNPETFPRIGDLIGFVRKEKILDATYQIAAIQRDFGNREERAKSRFKYTIDKYGVSWFVTEFEKRFGEKLEKAHEFKLEKRGDHFGWKQDYLGQNHFTLFVEAGRIFGEMKKALLEIAEKNLGNFRCTNNQNIIISDVAPENKKAVEKLLEKIEVNNVSPIRLDSIACVALNTCSLALAEGQRYLPSLITKIEPILEKYNLAQEPISIRMTGCPNGCGRPYLAEIGLVGKSLGKYNLFLGGDRLGKRLNRLYKEDLGEAEILAELDGFLGKYSEHRQSQEDFGDFILRTYFQGENHVQ
jgi:sulfite reductase (NADPH) hemoprotein beta-component